MKIYVIIVVASDGSVSVAATGTDAAEMYSAMEDAVCQCICDGRPDLADGIETMKQLTSDGWELEDDKAYRVEVHSDAAIIRDGNECTRFAMQTIDIAIQ